MRRSEEGFWGGEEYMRWLLFLLCSVCSAQPQLYVSRIGAGTGLPGSEQIPEGSERPLQVRVNAEGEGYALEFHEDEGGGSANAASTVLTIPREILRAAEVARTSDHAFTLLVLPVLPGPVRIVISVDPGLLYAERYAALFATSPETSPDEED